MKNKKITLKEFFNSDKNLVIHCDTEEKANILLKAFDKLGKKWCAGAFYTEKTNWDEYKEKTCYSNEGTFCYKDWFLGLGTKVYEFEDVELGGRTMNDNVKKIFEMLGIEPNQEFKIKDSGDDYWHHRYFFDEDLTLKFIDNHSKEWLFASSDTFMGLVKGTYTIVKLPKKKKLRDWTIDDLKKWTNVNCKELTCDGCLFRNVFCSAYGIRVWIKHKDLYSDKFLDQEVEIPEE